MRKKRSILIVEDEDIIRTTLAEYLQTEGFAVTMASRVAEALEEAKKQDFDVAICDVQLPDGDGVHLLRRLHQLNPQLFVLIITAYATVENAVEAFTAGAYDYFTKPVMFEDLSNKLERLFQYREMFLENQGLRRELARSDHFEQIVGSSLSLIHI